MHLIPAVKYGGGLFMFWRYCAASGPRVPFKEEVKCINNNEGEVQKNKDITDA